MRKFVVSLLTVFLFSLLISLFSYTAQAGSLDDIYDIISSDPDYAGEIEKLNAHGASESDIRKFISAVETELKKKDTLTNENIKEAMADAILNLFISGNHEKVFDAVIVGWDLSVDRLLKAGSTNEVLKLLPQSFLAIGELVKEKLLETPDNTGPGSGGSGGGGGGGGSSSDKDESTVADSTEIANQIKAGTGEISLKIAKGTGSLQVKAADLAKIINAGMALKISCYENEATLAIPIEVLKGLSKGDLQISVTKLTASEAEGITGKLAAGVKRVGGIFEFSLKNTTTDSSEVNFNKPISLIFSYGESFLTNAEENNLAVYRYNEDNKTWDNVGGTIDQSTKTIICPVNHFSKYTVMTRPTKTFADIAGHWAQSEIEFLATLKILSGVSETSFEPNRPVTRAEFATLLVNALEIPSKEVSGTFSDVPQEAWYASSVYRACSAGLASGLNENSFGPQQNISRQEMAAMVVNALAYKDKLDNLPNAEVNISSFSDYHEISSWAEKSMMTALKSQVITGRSEKILAPRAVTTRAEAAVIIKRLLSIIE
ncbi:MAG: S-layer homology domain-containing protein [Dehalobacterium sp.]